MDQAIMQANNTGKADYVMRTEIDHLKQDLYDLPPKKLLFKKKEKKLIT